MASPRPRVITDVGLAEFVQHVLDDKSQPSHLVVCASKEVFVQQLLDACVQPNRDADERSSQDGEPTIGEEPTAATHTLLKRPSLLQLASSRRVKLAFCPTITHLRAHLSLLAIPKPRHTNIKPDGESNQQGLPLLAILNPVDLHRATSSFSAQGLNRTFALAVEAAHATQSHLNLVEFPSFGPHTTEDFEVDYDLDSETIRPPPSANIWDEEVSILNVTTKSFGTGGRGWVGRTVTVRRIAERWCVFTVFQRKE